MALKSNDKPHHHGNLRHALIEAGLDLLREEGLGALTLRACAARAGVSHAAPAHHFAGLPGLKAAIAAVGFAELTRAMLTARDKVPADALPGNGDGDGDGVTIAPVENTARARLLAICEGYLAFALDQPPLFQLTFNSGVDFSLDPDLTDNSREAFAVLAETCSPFRSPGSGKPGGTEMMVWSQIHGFANLKIANCIGPPDAPSSLLEFADFLPVLALKNHPRSR